MDIRKRLILKRVAMHWNNLPREEMESSSLEMFKKHLYVVLGDMV